MQARVLVRVSHKILRPETGERIVGFLRGSGEDTGRQVAIMARADWEAEWQALSEEVCSGMADWRAAHPRATFAEIEAAVGSKAAACTGHGTT